MDIRCNIKNRDELIAGYLSGELSEEKIKDFEEHYFQCEVCLSELKAADSALKIVEREGSSLLSKQTAEKKSGNFVERLIGLSGQQRWAIAFGTAVIILLVIIFSSKMDESTQTEEVISEENNIEEEIKPPDIVDDKTPTEKEDIALLEGPAFTTSPYLEEWISENIRSDHRIIDTVISPSLGEILKGTDIVFNWRMNSQDELSIKVMNNFEDEIYFAKADPSQFPVYTIKLTSRTIKRSGLYYWRIEDDNDVLYVGKFYYLRNH